MLLSLNKIFQPNFPHRSVLSLSNAIVGASVLSMGYCFQQVTDNLDQIEHSSTFSIIVRGHSSDTTDNSLCSDYILFV